MKLSLATLTTFLALSSVSEAWSCSYSGANNQNLKNAVNDFDKLFGKNKLKAAKYQCYTSMCRGYYFRFCNSSAATRTENSGMRDKVKNTGIPRNNGDKCNENGASRSQDFAYLHYHFGSISRMSDCAKRPTCGLQKNDIRKC
ncbi:hypothetical protein CC79DRAFT_1356382 [Sarocladium strictum]